MKRIIGFTQEGDLATKAGTTPVIQLIVEREILQVIPPRSEGEAPINTKTALSAFDSFAISPEVIILAADFFGKLKELVEASTKDGEEVVAEPETKGQPVEDVPNGKANKKAEKNLSKV